MIGNNVFSMRRKSVVAAKKSNFKFIPTDISLCIHKQNIFQNDKS